jgi:hypothetical protein
MGQLTNNMINKTPRNAKYFFIAGLLIVLVVLSVKSKGFDSNANNKTIINQINQVTTIKESTESSIVVDFGNNQKYSSSQTNKTNALEALQEITDTNKLALEIKKYDFGTLVIKIGDKVNTKDNAWFYKINGKTTEMAADKYILKPGDNVEWMYEKINK